MKITDKRKVAKNDASAPKTRSQMRDANRKYHEADKEVKRSCREDKRNYVNNLANDAGNAAMKGDLGTLYNISRKLSGRSQNTNKPLRDQQGKVIKNMEEELKRLKDRFEQVLNGPEPAIEPSEGPELPICTGNITKSEIRDALKSRKNGKAAGPNNILAEASRREEIYLSTSYMAS